MVTCRTVCEADGREVAGNYVVVEDEADLSSQQPYSGLLAYDAAQGMLRVWERDAWGGVTPTAGAASGAAITSGSPPVSVGGGIYVRSDMTALNANPIYNSVVKVLVPFPARLSSWVAVLLTKPSAAQTWDLAMGGSGPSSPTNSSLGHFPLNLATLPVQIMAMERFDAADATTITAAAVPTANIGAVGTVPAGPTENHMMTLAVPWW